MKPRILIYKTDSEQERQIRSAVIPMGIQVRRVLESELALTLEELAMADDIAESAEDKSPDNEGQALIMCGFSKLQFELFMGLFSRKKLKPIPVKAMLTENNRNWEFGKLIDEIWQEHRIMTQKRS